MEALAKLVIVLAILFGVDLLFAQLVAFLLASFHVNSGIWQDFMLVVLLSAIAGGSSKAAK